MYSKSQSINQSIAEIFMDKSTGLHFGDARVRVRVYNLRRSVQLARKVDLDQPVFDSDVVNMASGSAGEDHGYNGSSDLESADDDRGERIGRWARGHDRRKQSSDALQSNPIQSSSTQTV